MMGCPLHNPFRVDKEKSLTIMREVLFHLKANDEISLNVEMDWNDYYSETTPTNVIVYRHKIAVVELDLGDYLPIQDNSIIDVDSVSDVFYKAVKEQKYERSTQIELHFGSEIVEDKIHLDAYLHETSASCDLSYPCFSYDEFYRTWIVKQEFWGAPKGVDGNGVVLMLDFTAYGQE